MNRLLRSRWGDGPERLGSMIEIAKEPVQSENRIAV
jgi:hypothetical protein